MWPSVLALPTLANTQISTSHLAWRTLSYMGWDFLKGASNAFFTEKSKAKLLRNL